MWQVQELDSDKFCVIFKYQKHIILESSFFKKI